MADNSQNKEVNSPEVKKPDTTASLAAAFTELFKDQAEYRKERLKTLDAQGESVRDLAKEAALPTPEVKEAQGALETEANRQAKEPVPLPKEPATFQKPERIRPFGTGTGPMQSLQNTLNSLGLIIAMGIGSSRGYAQGALAAYSGALDGWAKGDAARAENQWKEYLQNVTEANQEWKRQMDAREALIKNNKDTLENLRVQLAIREAQQGTKKELVNLMMKDHEQAMKMFELEGKELDRLLKFGMDQLKFASTEAEKKRMNDARIQSMKDLRAARSRSLESNEKYRDRLLEHFDIKTHIPQIESASKFMGIMGKIERAYDNIMQKKPDLIPHSDELVDKWIARLEQGLHPGDEDLIIIKTHWNSAIVGLFDRGWADEKGVRALAVFQTQIDPSNHMALPPTAFHKLINSYRELVTESVKTRRSMMNYYSSATPGVKAAIDDLIQHMDHGSGYWETQQHLQNLFEQGAQEQ